MMPESQDAWGRETKWPPFCRRHFQLHFLKLNVLHLDSNFNNEFVSNDVINNNSAVTQVMAWHRKGYIITWLYSFLSVNISILISKREYGTWIESHITHCTHCYVTWCPLAIWFVVPHQWNIESHWNGAIDALQWRHNERDGVSNH